MRLKHKRVLGGLFAAVLGVTALAGCSSSEEDRAACETFSEVFAAAQELSNTSPAEAAATMEEGAPLIVDQARDPELVELMDQFTSDYALLVGVGDDAPEDEEAYFDFLINFLKIGETCQGLGVDVEGYSDIMEGLDADGMTVDDLEEMVRGEK